jgi:DNA-binding response OmpR family regulator
MKATGSKPTILLVEDDPLTTGTVTAGLGSEFDVLVRAKIPQRGGECAEVLVQNNYAALVLGMQLEHENWLDLLQEIRRHDQTLPIILLIDSAPSRDLVPALHAGACDFIRKPVEVQELDTRLHLLMRNRGRPAQDILAFGGIEMDRLRHEVSVHGEPLELTRLEYSLLECFLTRTEGVHTRRSLLQKVWGMDFDPGTNVVDVHIANLRRKLRQRAPNAVILTVRGVGFRLTATLAAAARSA